MIIRGVPRWSVTSQSILRVQASTSTTLVQLSTVALITTLILLVSTGSKVIFFQTLLLPVTLPPGTVVHALPFQYCTSKAVNPIWLNLVVSVGSIGFEKLSCNENTSISRIVFRPLKSTCTHCGKLLPLAAQLPPEPAFTPLRSPLMTAPAG